MKKSSIPEFNLDNDDYPCHEHIQEPVEDDIESLDDIDFLDDLDDNFSQALADNRLDDFNEMYNEYSSTNKGCSKDDPFVIKEEDDYISIEKQIIDYLFTEAPFRLVSYKFLRQSLSTNCGRKLDRLTYEVTDPIEDKTHLEEYWFDITAGYNKASRMLGSKD